MHTNESIATFGFSSLLLGARDFSSPYLENKLDKADAFRRPWLPSKTGTQGFDGQKPDFLRPGELVQVIAINRATGYIGTTKIRTSATNEIAIEHPIHLGPPNLTIMAGRAFEDCSGLIAPDTLIRDNYYQLLRCHNESETNIQTVF